MCTSAKDPSGSRRDRGSLPFCYLTLLAKRPLEKAYPKTLKTIGDYLRKRRLDLGLYQKEVAVTIGVDTTTVYNWENNRTAPPLRFSPRIARFLHHELPTPKPTTLGETIKRYRYLRGISQKGLASQLGVDPTTLARWEKDEGNASGSLRERLSQFLKGES